MSPPLLFSPLTIRELTLRNRVVVAPMHQYSATQGHATDWHLMNAGRFAAGGAGLVMVESTKIERRGCSTVSEKTRTRPSMVIQNRPLVNTRVENHCMPSGIGCPMAWRKYATTTAAPATVPTA